MQYSLFQPAVIPATEKQEVQPEVKAVIIQAEYQPEDKPTVKPKNRIEDSDYGMELAKFNARYTEAVTDELFKNIRNK